MKNAGTGRITHTVVAANTVAGAWIDEATQRMGQPIFTPCASYEEQAGLVSVDVQQFLHALVRCDGIDFVINLTWRSEAQ
jgi:hypothetical protein